MSEMEGKIESTLSTESTDEQINGENVTSKNDDVFQNVVPDEQTNESQVDVKVERTSDSNSSGGQQLADDEFAAAEEDEDGDNEHDEEGGEPGKFFFQLLPTHCAKGKGGRKVYKCDVCGGVYRHAFSLKRHYLRTHINYEFLSDADISNCNISISQTNVKKAEDAASSETNEESGVMRGLYRCHMCAQLFDDVRQLKHHIVNHPTPANEKRFPCTQCDMTFSHRQNLVRHLSVHSGEKPYPCRYCGKCFPTATNQKRHERIHEGVKPYVCNHCTSLFTQSGDLKKHIRKQHASFFHPCAFCVKYFIDESQLAKHLTTHGEDVDTNKKEWTKRNAMSLTMKNKRVTNSRNKNYSGEGTTSHRNTLHHNKFTCNTCNKKFGSYLNLKRHQQSVHAKSGGRTQRLTTSIIKPMACTSSNDQVILRELPMTEADFYADIAYNISDNLLNHLDGKINEFHQPPPESNEQCSIADLNSPITNCNHDWTSYNFPSWFAPEDAGNHQENSTKPNEIFDFSTPKTAESDPDPTMHVESVTLSHSDMLYSLALSPVESSGSSTEFQCVDGVLDLSTPGKESRNSQCSVDYSHTLQVPRTYVCFACGENENSYEDMENHKINNHPNVYCTHLEIEGIKEIPLQLFKQNCSPVGILQNCSVAPLISSMENLVCTKCGSNFSTVPDLHCHMLECGGHKESLRGPSRQRRGKSIRRKKLVKRGMKRKLEETPQKKSPPFKKVKRESLDRSVPAFTRSSISSKPCLSMPYSCPGCNKEFNHQSGLDRHMKSCPQNVMLASKKLDRAKEASKQQHSCPYCVRSFTYLASLKKHVSDCVSRKEKRRSSEGKSGKKKKARSKSDNVEVDNSSESEGDEETTSSGFSSSGKLENMNFDDCPPFVELPPPPPPALPPPATPVSSSSVSQIKKELAEEGSGQQMEYFSEVNDGSEVNNLSEEDEESGEKCVTEIKTEDEKREGEGGHCHSCPHCRRTYTYLANFKKHVTEACPLRKDPPKGTQRNVKDVKLVGENKKKGKDGSDDKVEASVEEYEEEVDVSEEENVDDEGSRGSVESVVSSVGEETKTKSEGRGKRKTKINEHLNCPICRRNFDSYVKLLQHQLSHKLKQDGKKEQSESKSSDNNLEGVSESANGTSRTKNSRRKSTAQSKTNAPKHKGGWPKGKSRKGYIPKHKRGATNSTTTTAVNPTTTINTTDKVDNKNVNSTTPKMDRSKENERNLTSKHEEMSQNDELTSNSVAGVIISNKVPLEEQPANNNVIGVNHLEAFHATGVLQRVKARSTKNSLLSSKPDSAPPAVVAS